jgi:hypothetical protein
MPRTVRLIFRKSMYLIHDNGYLRWPISIGPYTHVDQVTIEGYFSANLKSVCKDVECTSLGILKKGGGF